MRRSQAAKYARWSAAAAGMVTLAVAGVYAYRAWRAVEARREAPPAVPPAVQQQAAEFSFSKLEGGRKLFTVRASRTTEFTGGNLNRLEDVRITVYGRRGDRFDKIHTRACDYDPQSGDIACTGTVEIALAAARPEEPQIEDWEEIAPSPHAVYVQTANVKFSSETGVVRTDQPVRFTFPQGSGRGTGISYDTREGIARLHGTVELAVEAPDLAGGAPVELSGAGLEFIRSTGTLLLHGPVEARQGNRILAAGALGFELDDRFRVRRAAARGAPQLVIRERGRTRTLRAAEFSARLLAGGGIERLDAAGNVAGSLLGEAVAVQFTADRLAIAFDAAGKLPELVTLAGNVRGQANRAEQTQQLETDELRLTLASAAGGGQRLTLAESGTKTRLGWETSQENFQLAGDRLRAAFDPAGRLQQLTGGNGVEIRRRSLAGATGTEELISRSREFVLRFVSGGWSELEQVGDVRIRQGELTAQAARARFTQADDSAVLTGDVAVSDGNTRLLADRFHFYQRSGEIRAEGNVRTGYLFSGTGAATNFAAEPAMIAAASLQASRQTHRAVYSGGARLWQGPAVIESERMEIDQAAQQLVAEGKVRAVLPEPAAPDAGSLPRLWRVSSGRLLYRSAEGRARFADGVRADSADSRISAAWIELQLSEAGGKREIQRVSAGGGVTVRQGSRWATAARASYFAEEKKFVLFGGTPAMHDALGNTVSGAELTFFLASDTIFVKSEEGSRTLTRYRVER